MNYAERGLVFPCMGEDLVGVLALPDRPFKVGLVIVVGGPQYRAGSHRQFVLLARTLARAGYPVLRFDYRGMGDGSGEARDFEDVDPDIRAAMDCLQQECPAVRQVVLWGLCDAASAILMYYARQNDVRLAGLALCNPWARSSASFAKAQIKHYYGQRLFQLAFWKKALRGELRIGESLREGFGALRQAGFAAPVKESSMTFQSRMALGFDTFPGSVLLILSGRDLTAREFVDYARSNNAWRRMDSRKGVRCIDLPDADHTFSSSEWRGQVADATRAFLDELVIQCGES